LLVQVRDREPSLGRGAKVVAVSLDKVGVSVCTLTVGVKPSCINYTALTSYCF